MNFVNLFFSLLLASALGFGMAFIVLTYILNKSNNMGDSKSDFSEFSNDAIFTSKEDRIPSINMNEYCDSTLTGMVQSNSFRSRQSTALRPSPDKMVSRLISNEDDSTMRD